jgi:hypothetical protein
MNRLRRAAVAAGTTIGRSFFPIATLVVILGTLAWGPWVSLTLTIAIWELIGWVA